MLIDLQLHSKHSDGYFSPYQLAKLLAKFKVKVASLTDHNSIAGQMAFKKACQAYGLKTINGLELYVRHNNYTFNILWYNYDLNSPELLSILENTWQRRRKKIIRLLKSLARRGFIINLDNYFKQHQNYLPINHLINHLWLKSTNRRIIRRDLKEKNPREEDIIAYYFYPKTGPKLKEARISFSRLVKLRNKIGGQLILAHPCLHRTINKKLIIDLNQAGLDGVELLSPHHNYNSIVILASIIKELDLIALGGSDFHLPADEGTGPRYSWDWFKIDSDHLRKISKIIA